MMEKHQIEWAILNVGAEETVVSIRTAHFPQDLCVFNCEDEELYVMTIRTAAGWQRAVTLCASHLLQAAFQDTRIAVRLRDRYMEMAAD